MIDSLLWAGFANGVMVAVLAPVLWLASRCIRSAPLRHALWLILLVKLVTPPLISIPLPARTAEPAPTIAVVGDSPSQASVALQHESHRSPVQFEEAKQHFAGRSRATDSLDWQRIGRTITYVWLASSVVWYGVASVRLMRFARLAAASPVAPETWQTDARRLAVRLRLRRVPQVRLVNGRVPPLLWAILRRPAVVLPEALATQLSRQERWMLLTHELAHLARGDHWTRRLELIVLGLYWWHPGAWLTCRQLRQAEEECCDAYVAWLWPHASHAYAHLLLNTLDFLATDAAVPIGVSGFASATTFRTRFAMILQGRSSRRLTRGSKTVVMLLALPFMLLCLGSAPDDPGNMPERKASQLADRSLDPDRILFEQVSCDATEVPLSEVLAQIMAGGPKFEVDMAALRLKGISLDQKLSLHVERVTRRSALNLILKPLKLEHRLHDGAIYITAADEPGNRPLVDRRYYIRDLTSSRWSQAYPGNALHSLIELIKSTVEPSTWEAISFLKPSTETAKVASISKSDDGTELLICQTEEAHQQIQRLLKQLRSNYQVVDQEQAEARIHLVRKRASWRFVATPLDEVLKQVSKTYDVNIHLDEQTLLAAKLQRSTPITWQATEAKLEDALPLMLGPLGLDYVIQDEVIKIVSDGYGIPVVTMVYGVSDVLNLTRRDGSPRTAADLQPLVDQIKCDVSPDSWADYAAISVFSDNLSLVVSHNEAGHRAVAKYLNRLREANVGAVKSRAE